MGMGAGKHSFVLGCQFLFVMRHKATYRELVVQRGLKVTGVKKKVKGDKSRLDLKAWPWQ